MKIQTTLIAALATLALCHGSHAQTYIDNGTFAQGAIGANSTGAVDTTTFPDFRFFNVAMPTVGFNAREVNIAGVANTTTGLRLDVNNTNGDPAGAYGFDNNNDLAKTTPGQTYVLSFLAGVIGGGTNLTVATQAYTGSGSVTGNTIGVASSNNFTLANTVTTPNGDPNGTGPYGNLVLYTLSYTAPAGGNGVDITFVPGAGITEADAFAITDIALTVPEPGTTGVIAGAALIGALCLLRKRMGRSTAR